MGRGQGRCGKDAQGAGGVQAEAQGTQEGQGAEEAQRAQEVKKQEQEETQEEEGPRKG